MTWIWVRVYVGVFVYGIGQRAAEDSRLTGVGHLIGLGIAGVGALVVIYAVEAARWHGKREVSEMVLGRLEKSQQAIKNWKPSK